MIRSYIVLVYDNMTVLMYMYSMKSYADHAFCMLHPLETYIMLTVYTKEFSSLILWITWVLVIFFSQIKPAIHNEI